MRAIIFAVSRDRNNKTGLNPSPKECMAHRRLRAPGAGRPSILNDDLFGKLRVSVLRGEPLKKFADDNGIPEKTVIDWKYSNYKGFSEKEGQFRRERIMKLAEGNIEEILVMSTQNVRASSDGSDVVVTDPALVRVKADMTKFAAETLGKDFYSKRSELTGADGNELIPVDKTTKALSDQALHEYLHRDNPQIGNASGA